MKNERFIKKVCVHCKKTIYKMDSMRVPKGKSKRWCCKPCYNEKYINEIKKRR